MQVLETANLMILTTTSIFPPSRRSGKPWTWTRTSNSAALKKFDNPRSKNIRLNNCPTELFCSKKSRTRVRNPASSSAERTLARFGLNFLSFAAVDLDSNPDPWWSSVSFMTGWLRGTVVDVLGHDAGDATRVSRRRRQPRQRLRQPEQAGRLHQGQEVRRMDQGCHERMKLSKVFFKIGQPWSIFYIYFCLFVQIILAVSRIRTRIFWVEG